jgi:hypothetical protein
MSAQQLKNGFIQLLKSFFSWQSTGKTIILKVFSVLCFAI